MKETIYTIPVTEAFSVDCECPVCLLEKRLEDEYINYFLGPSLMEPDHRAETNKEGFCKRHLSLLYQSQENRLGLGLMLDTHMVQQLGEVKKMYKSKSSAIKTDAGASFIKSVSGKLSAKTTETEKFVNEMVKFLDKLEVSCSICNQLDHTMDRYMDVILYLWHKEEDFRKLFNSKKGFCLKHMKEMLTATGKYLNGKEAAAFVDNLMEIQLPQLERLQQEVNWFTLKFDYRNTDAPWGNSKDSLPRAIQKLTGSFDLD